MIDLFVDAETFPVSIPRRQKTCALLKDFLSANRHKLNEPFFGHMESYTHRRMYHPELCLPDLFAPNICAIDFAARFLPKDGPILDYGCGLGICDAYLAELGFAVAGYDNWSQIPAELAADFRRSMESPVPVVGNCLDIEPTVVMHVSLWLVDKAVWDRPRVKWILADTHYVNSYENNCPAGFRLDYLYAGYLAVFRRVE